MNKCRNFLLLQGPIGPFFKELADALKVGGSRIHKINFWGGDQEFFPEAFSFKGTIEEWPRFFHQACVRNSITDLVLFGDRREYHEVAIEVAAHTNPDLRIWVFEEGYFRPNWITLDQFGVNARSALPTSYRDLMDEVGGLKEVRDPGNTQVEPWIREFAPIAAKYYLSGFLKSGSFPNFKYSNFYHISNLAENIK